MGMVLTMVVVADEDDADRAMEMAREASHEHPARVLGVILGDGRGDVPGRRPGRHRLGLDRRDRADPARAARWSSTPTRWCCRCCCPTPRSPSGGPPTRPRTRRRTRSASWRSGGSPTPPTSSRGKSKALHAQCRAYTPGNTDLAWTRLTPWRALLAAALDQHPLKVTGGAVDRRAGQPVRRPAGGLAAATGSRSTSTRKGSGGPGITEVELRDPRGSDPDLAAGRPAGDVLLARPPRPADRAAPPGRARAAGRGAPPARRGRRVRRRREDADQEQVAVTAAPRIEVHESSRRWRRRWPASCWPGWPTPRPRAA